MAVATSMVALLACLAPIAASGARPLTFKNAQLGMTLAEWRSLAPRRAQALTPSRLAPTIPVSSPSPTILSA